MVNYIFIMTGKDTHIWSKMSGHIADGYRPVAVLDSASNHENTVTFVFRIQKDGIGIT